MLYIALLVVVCGVSFVYCLLIEMPFISLDKFLMSYLSKNHSKTKSNQINAVKTEISIELPKIDKSNNVIESF
jgi:hypothetical protein